MFIKNKQLIEPKEHAWFKCYAPVVNNGALVAELSNNPRFTWTGAPMPLAFIGQIVAFFKEVYKVHKSEAQLRLFYDERGWAAQVRPQEVSGAATKELEPDEKTEVFPGALEIGTIHSHSNFGASQSSTDKSDEHNTNGVHLTVGNVDAKILSWHSRAYFEGVEHDVNLGSLIQILPEGYECLTEEALKRLPELCGAVEFPKAWLGQVKTHTYARSRDWRKDSYTPSSPHQSGGSWYGGLTGSPKEYVADMESSAGHLSAEFGTEHPSMWDEVCDEDAQVIADAVRETLAEATIDSAVFAVIVKNLPDMSDRPTFGHAADFFDEVVEKALERFQDDSADHWETLIWEEVKGQLLKSPTDAK